MESVEVVVDLAQAVCPQTSLLVLPAVLTSTFLLELASLALRNVSPALEKSALSVKMVSIQLQMEAASVIVNYPVKHAKTVSLRNVNLAILAHSSMVRNAYLI